MQYLFLALTALPLVTAFLHHAPLKVVESTGLAAVVPPPPPSAQDSSCGLELIATYLTTVIDWQRGIYTDTDNFEYIRHFYESAQKSGVGVTILHDSLTQPFINTYTTSKIKFVKVNPALYPYAGVNDVRFLMFGDLIAKNPQWQYIFNVDISDVTLTTNFCSQLQPDKVYAGSEAGTVNNGKGSPADWPHTFVKGRFQDLGGKYAKWWDEEGTFNQVLNCGILGGARSVMIDIYAGMKDVISDPKATNRVNKVPINADMAVLQYVVRRSKYEVVTGAPVHSRFTGYETTRKDVWIIHKLFEVQSHHFAGYLG